MAQINLANLNSDLFAAADGALTAHQFGHANVDVPLHRQVHGQPDGRGVEDGRQTGGLERRKPIIDGII